MTIQNSPYPWSIYQGGPEKFNMLADSNGRAVARFFHSPTSSRDAEIAKAAPDMLAELDRIDFELGQMILNDGKADVDMLRRWKRGVMAAIAKAGGELAS